MYWKKSQSDSLKSGGKSDRVHYRVVPDKNDPVILQVDGNLMRVVDISAGGVSCTSDFLVSGQIYRARINLPDERADVYCELEVLCKDNDYDNMYHCSFIDVDSINIDRLHHYVLERQKIEIKSAREHIS